MKKKTELHYYNKIDNSRKNIITLDVQGCIDIDDYEHVISKNVKIPIYIFGENHQWEGNSDEILQKIYSNTNCPIDILLEAPFHTSKIKSVGRSNVHKLIQTYQDCFKSDTVISQSKFTRDPSDFLEKCIKPFKGRVKFWAIDHRWIFTILSCGVYEVHERLNAFTDRQRYTMIKQSVLDMTQKFINSIFDLWLSKDHDTQIQYDNIMNDFCKSLIDLFVKVAVPVEHELRRLISDVFSQQSQLTRDVYRHSYTKYFLKIKDKIGTYQLSHSIYESWRNVFLHERMKDPMTIFIDMFIVLKLFDIITRNKNGIILVFVGDAHRRNIQRMLTCREYTRPSIGSKLPKIVLKHQYDDYEESLQSASIKMTLHFPKTCDRPTLRMTKYVDLLESENDRLVTKIEMNIPFDEHDDIAIKNAENEFLLSLFNMENVHHDILLMIWNSMTDRQRVTIQTHPFLHSFLQWKRRKILRVQVFIISCLFLMLICMLTMAYCIFLYLTKRTTLKYKLALVMFSSLCLCFVFGYLGIKQCYLLIYLSR